MYKEDLRQRYYVYKPMYNKTNVNSHSQQGTQEGAHKP